MLTPGVTHNVGTKARRLVSAVLVEQARQVASGECDLEKLACVAQHHSQWAAERAIGIGTHGALV